ncbi:MAG TPA: ComF family protein [Saprospiraceae bacterium]|nr:ComF family protein [Saprospiraceae bacterium]
MNTLRKMTSGLLGLLYPRLCLSCGLELPPGEEKICLHCVADMHFTDYHLSLENHFSDRLFGRIPFYATSALLTFRKGGKTQPILHELKYKGNHQIGVELGRQHGRILQESPYFQQLDWILPVPLHIKKKRLRGYNQSAVYAQGLSEILQVPFSDHILIRKTFTETQTKKGKDERFQNVNSVFGVAQPKLIHQKHVLIVDDVMTTGATLESCANALLSAADVRISFATIAIAEY